MNGGSRRGGKIFKAAVRQPCRIAGEWTRFRIHRRSHAISGGAMDAALNLIRRIRITRRGTIISAQARLPIALEVLPLLHREDEALAWSVGCFVQLAFQILDRLWLSSRVC